MEHRIKDVTEDIKVIFWLIIVYVLGIVTGILVSIAQILLH